MGVFASTHTFASRPRLSWVAVSALASLLSSGCIIAIDDTPRLVDEEFPEDNNDWHPNRCRNTRIQCEGWAGEDPRLEERCYDAYLKCSDGARDESIWPHKTQSNEEETPQPSTKPNDLPWSQRCNTLQTRCLAAASTGDAKDTCLDLGVACRTTQCAPHTRCSDHRAPVALLSCWERFRGCNTSARDDDEIESCGMVFRLCAQAVPSLEALADADAEDVVDCLSDAVDCHSFATEPELKQTCDTVLQHCL